MSPPALYFLMAATPCQRNARGLARASNLVPTQVAAAARLDSNRQLTFLHPILKALISSKFGNQETKLPGSPKKQLRRAFSAMATSSVPRMAQPALPE